jgi:hypothetical protein
MYDILLAHWCFLPYLGVLLFLTVMSIREGKAVKRTRSKAPVEPEWQSMDGLLGGRTARALILDSSRYCSTRSDVTRASGERPRS